MHFEKDHTYHIYNQGNNHRRVFFSPKNYKFFVKKIRQFIVPYGDVISWCLMPNHFHLMVRVNHLELGVNDKTKKVLKPQDTDFLKTRTINQSIAIMLSSYTRAINKQEKFSGSLFRGQTKASCVTCPHRVTPSYYQTQFGARINIANPKKEYLQTCFQYIHENPVKAKLVPVSTEWQYSSAKEYYEEIKDPLANIELGRQLTR